MALHVMKISHMSIVFFMINFSILVFFVPQFSNHCIFVTQHYYHLANFCDEEEQLTFPCATHAKLLHVWWRVWYYYFWKRRDKNVTKFCKGLNCNIRICVISFICCGHELWSKICLFVYFMSWSNFVYCYLMLWLWRDWA